MEVISRRRVPAARKAAIVLAALALIALGAVVWLNSGMRTAMRALAVARVSAVTARAMNEAILERMAEQNGSEPVIEVRETGERVYMLEADTAVMNRLAAECAEAAQEKIAEIGEQGISVPVGTITGIPILAGKGPRIKVSFTPAGSVTSEFDSSFTSSGINQTLYRVKLSLTALVQIVMPGVNESVKVSAEAAIAESLVVGDVPEVYTNVADTEDMMNLIPTEVP